MRIKCPRCDIEYQIDDAEKDPINPKDLKCKACNANLFPKSEYQDKTVVISMPPPEPGKDQVSSDSSQTPNFSIESGNPKTIGLYQVEGILGKGGMGTVYKCMDVALHRPVAIKVLLLEENESRGRFFKEARALAKLSHPNITQIYTTGEEEGFPYFVMEFVDGPSCKALLAQEDRFSISKALDIAIQVCDGLKKAHQNDVIHRDIKPANILINSEGIAKITDFGLAKLLSGDHELTKTKMVMGTPSFISPEQGRGEKIDFRTDIYSLGVMLYQMIIGRLPFDAEDAITLIMKHIKEPVTFPSPTPELSVPPAIAGIIRKMMAKDPNERFLSYDQLIYNLSRLKKSFQALQAGESQMALPAQLKTLATDMSSVTLGSSHLSPKINIPEKHTRSSFLFSSRFTMPIVILILLGFFGLIIKSGMKNDTGSIIKKPLAPKSIAEPVSPSCRFSAFFRPPLLRSGLIGLMWFPCLLKSKLFRTKLNP